MASSSFAALREEVVEANRQIARSGLVTLAFGNASGVDRDANVLVIKPSGVPCADVRPDQLVVVDLGSGAVTEGELRPSSDTPTHLALYRRYADIGGVVHTHSTAASAWAQAFRAIPVFGTTHADHFGGPVPVTRPMTREEIGGAYEAETGALIVETLEVGGLGALEMPAVLVASHGPFTWGADASGAAINAVALEAVAAMAALSVQLRPDLGPIDQVLLDRHFQRKHGPSAYYGQEPRSPDRA